MNEHPEKLRLFCDNCHRYFDANEAEDPLCPDCVLKETGEALLDLLVNYQGECDEALYKNLWRKKDDNG